MSTVRSYTKIGGKHPETASLTNTLASLGVNAPHSGQPYSEAMLLGIGGGLGVGYILWEFEAHNATVLVLGFQYRWNYMMEYMENVCDRVGAKSTFKETTSRKAAADQLNAALDAGIPAIAWVDLAHMPYHQLPDVRKGHIGHLVTIFGIENERALIDDLADKRFTMTLDELADARARITSYKNRLMLVEAPRGDIDLAAAIKRGIADCVDYLGGSSESFALPVLRKWARTMTDPKNKKGWPVVFKDQRGLYGTLKSLFEGVELMGTGGGGLRGLYADFLQEAAPIVKLPALNGVAQKYRDLSGMWTDLAEAALPSEVDVFNVTKALMRRKYAALNAKGDGAFDEVREITGQINALHAQYGRTFPMDDGQVMALFSDLKDRLLAIHDAEKETLSALKNALE